MGFLSQETCRCISADVKNEIIFKMINVPGSTFASFAFPNVTVKRPVAV